MMKMGEIFGYGLSDGSRIIRMKGTILLTDVSVLNGTFLRKSVDAYEENLMKVLLPQ